MPTCVLIDGPDVTNVRNANLEKHEPVPLAHAVGIQLDIEKLPLKAPPRDAKNSTDAVDRRHPAMRLMVDPASGLALQGWESSAAETPTPLALLGRTDGRPFTVDDFMVLDEYCCARHKETPFSVSATSFAHFLRGRDDGRGFLDLRWPKGTRVLAQGLRDAKLNGKEGVCVGLYKSGRVGVEWPAPWGVKAIRTQNLKMLPVDAGAGSATAMGPALSPAMAASAAAAPSPPPPPPSNNRSTPPHKRTNLSEKQKRNYSNRAVRNLTSAILEDVYPHDDVEGVFGIEMADEEFGVLENEAPSTIVYYVWTELLHDFIVREYKNGPEPEDEDEQEKIAELARAKFENILCDAIARGRIKELFAEQARELAANGEARDAPCAYSRELLRRGLECIPWYDEALDALVVGQTS